MRGRAASAIRTGAFIKQYLEAHGPAYIAEIHYALKQAWRNINEGRPRERRVAPPTYESFGKYLRNCRELGLVELDHEEAMEEVLPGGPLKSIRGGKIVDSTRRYYRLTTRGTEDTESWDDPIRALGHTRPAPAPKKKEKGK